MKRFIRRFLGAFALVATTSACVQIPDRTEQPRLPELTQTRSFLLDMPAPDARIDVAVYAFEDLTGQIKPSEGFQNPSRAVSQGGVSVLLKALRETSGGDWFRVIERNKLNNLLQERRVIQEMRQLYLGEQQINPQALPPLLFAGIIIEGGVVGFDSNVQTGGAGAALLGIGAKTEYRKDTISVSLRAVSVKTGEILSSVMVQKSILSVSIGSNVFRYIEADEILELEAGVTSNEPDFVALTKTIEKAVYALIMEMVSRDYWSFKDEASGRALVEQYLREDGRASRGVTDQTFASGKPS